MTIEERIQSYLGNGGLINPEMMEHDKVRQLILDCRAEIERLQMALCEPARHASRRVARSVIADLHRQHTTDYWDETLSLRYTYKVMLTVSEVRWAAVTLDPSLEPLLRAIEKGKA